MKKLIEEADQINLTTYNAYGFRITPEMEEKGTKTVTEYAMTKDVNRKKKSRSDLVKQHG